MGIYSETTTPCLEPFLFFSVFNIREKIFNSNYSNKN